jgi:uncharacterized protein YpiB (UPF0302 family)
MELTFNEKKQYIRYYLNKFPLYKKMKLKSILGLIYCYITTLRRYKSNNH